MDLGNKVQTRVWILAQCSPNPCSHNYCDAEHAGGSGETKSPQAGICFMLAAYGARLQDEETVGHRATHASQSTAKSEPIGKAASPKVERAYQVACATAPATTAATTTNTTTINTTAATSTAIAVKAVPAVSCHFKRGAVSATAEPGLYSLGLPDALQFQDLGDKSAKAGV